MNPFVIFSVVIGVAAGLISYHLTGNGDTAIKVGEAVGALPSAALFIRVMLD